MTGFAVERLGDQALLLRLGERIDAETNRRVHALAAAIEAQRPAWLLDVVPGYASLALFVADTAADARDTDPLMHVERWLEAFPLPAPSGPAEGAEAPRSRHAQRAASTEVGDASILEIPVRYGGSHGPDLADVAAHAGLSPQAAIAAHAAGDYRVAMLGFAPGFPYLLGLDPRLAMPRMDTPRTRIPAGSVAIGGAQTGIYPRQSPGGWRIIGSTPLRLFDPARSPPSLLAPGQRVRFVPADEADTAAPVDDSAMGAAADDSGTAEAAATSEPGGTRPAARWPGPSGAAAPADPPVSPAGFDGRPTPLPARGGAGAAKSPPAGTELGSLESHRHHHTAAVEVLAPGLATSVQDFGRGGLRHLGVGGAGALDPYSYAVANLLVGNPPGAAALEIALTGPRLRFSHPVRIALCGAAIDAEADGHAIPGWRPVLLPAGCMLSLGPCRGGARAWLAIGGGVAVPRVLGSASTDLRGGFGGLQGRTLVKGDVLAIGGHPAEDVPRPRVSAWWVNAEPDVGSALPARIRLLPGGDATTPGDAVFGGRWSVAAASDRQGLRLDGRALGLAEQRDRISAPVAPGTVQLPPDGRPIVLLADAQTHGGYPRIGHAIRADWPRLAQLRPGDAIGFLPCTPAQARAAACEQRQRLNRIALAIQAKRRADD